MKITSPGICPPKPSPAPSSAHPFERNAPETKADTAALLEELKQLYPDVQFDIISFENKEEIKRYAASHTGTNHVALDPELLKKMASDPEMLRQVKDVLNSMDDRRFHAGLQAQLLDKKLLGMGLVLDEDGALSQWNVTADIQTEPQDLFAYETPDFSSWYPKKNENKISYASPYRYSHSSSMMKLAAAKNISAVRGLVAVKRAEISKVKLHVEDPAEAALIIRKIRSLIRNGDIKIARLRREERLGLQKRQAAKRLKRRLEQQLAEELRRKRTARKAQEHCQTSDLDDVLPTSSVSEQRYRQVTAAYAAVTPDAFTAVCTPLPAAAPAAGAAPAGGSAEITVDCSV